MLGTLTLLTALVPQGPIGTSTAPVVINEFVYNDGGTDDREYVELYNRSGSAVDISNWMVDGEDPGGPNASFTVSAGTTLAAGAYYVMGPTNGLVPNVNQNVGGDLFENDNEVVYLKDDNGRIIDAAAYELHRGAIPGATMEGEGFYGDFASRDGNPLCYARHYDGYDTDDNARDFRIFTQTPGLPNAFHPGTLPWTESFDGLGVNVTVPLMEWFWVPMTTIDPTVIGSWNNTVKPASPQGGLAAVLWDQAGGGNTARLQFDPVEDIVVEMYAYFEPPFDPNAAGADPNDGEAWGFGVRGMTDWAGDPRDVPGDYNAIRGASDQPGHSGIGWYYFRTQQYARVYLVDFNNSGDVNDFTILGGPIDIVAGQNDGWQRLRLHVSGTKVHGNFGGTYGADDGTRLVADSGTTGIGGLWMNYREFILDNTLIRPFTFDAVHVHASRASFGHYGSGNPTTFGVPQIDADGLPMVASQNWAITGSNHGAGSLFAGVVYGFQQGSFPVPNAPTGTTMLLIPSGSAVDFSLVNGESRFAFQIPNDPALVGVDIFWQIAEYDPALNAQLPIGVSDGLHLNIEN